VNYDLVFSTFIKEWRRDEWNGKKGAEAMN
jgi:hypothetical protein